MDENSMGSDSHAEFDCDLQKRWGGYLNIPNLVTFVVCWPDEVTQGME